MKEDIDPIYLAAVLMALLTVSIFGLTVSLISSAWPIGAILFCGALSVVVGVFDVVLGKRIWTMFHTTKKI